MASVAALAELEFASEPGGASSEEVTVQDPDSNYRKTFLHVLYGYSEIHPMALLRRLQRRCFTRGLVLEAIAFTTSAGVCACACVCVPIWFSIVATEASRHEGCQKCKGSNMRNFNLSTATKHWAFRCRTHQGSPKWEPQEKRDPTIIPSKFAQSCLTRIHTCHKTSIR